jgi:hypothetical protein
LGSLPTLQSFCHSLNFCYFSSFKQQEPLSPEELKELCIQLVNEISLPSQIDWSIDDVLFWIYSLGFPQYRETFKTNLIDGRKLIKIDASAVSRMNIRDFEHIKIITRSIREMYEIEMETHARSISLLPQNPETLFKLYKVLTGQVYEMCTRTDFFRKIKIVSEQKVRLNHFERLHQWLQHKPDFQHIRIGNIKRMNLYYVKPDQNFKIELEKNGTNCHKMPPYECGFSEKQKPWRLSVLVQVDGEKYADNMNT